ncbi:MAG: presqualene diphosphate synthase HpnD [Chloroflexi bacterium]|nr:presqualene diphosphate synthase HpnD [Chloroflexota bacterium]
MAERIQRASTPVAADGPGQPVDLQDAYDRCQAITKSGAKNFYYAFLTLPREKRRAIYAAYAFCRLCDDIADEPDPNGDRRARLDSVRADLAAAYAGKPEGHVFHALSHAAMKYRIPEQYFRDVVAGVEMDLSQTRYATFDELKDYCYHVASAVGLICIEVCEYSDKKAIEYAVDLGIAMQLTNILRDVEQDARNGRVYLPQEDLARFGYTEPELLAGVVDNRFRALMEFEVGRARTYFKSGEMLLPLLDRRARACPEVMFRIYRRLLSRIEERGYDVFGPRVSLSTPAKLSIMARSWLRSFFPIPG